MSISFSKEQERIQALRSGLVVVTANAGSGKTTTAAELFFRIFDEERAKRWPRDAELTTEHVKDLLGLFLLSSFTVKQAAELDERVKAGLRERGVAIPTRNGEEVRVCLNLDSHIQRWMRKGAFFRTWCRLDNSWLNDFAHLIDHLSPAARDSVRHDAQGLTLEGADQLRTLYYRMSPILSGEVQAMLAQILVRIESGPRVPMKLMPADLIARLHGHLAAIDPASPEWVGPFWQQILNEWRIDRLHYEEMTRNSAHHTGEVGPETKRTLSQWRKSVTTAERFLNLFQIARTRGYDPLFSPKYLGSQAFLEAFASAEGLDDHGVNRFHAWATAFATFKRAAGLLDFSDCLQTVVRVLSFNKALLEYDRDHPRWGFRFKFCFWDEKQDFTPTQNRLVDLLCAPEGRPGLSMAIGDSKQSIYLFAGASPYAFARMVKDSRERGDNVFTLTTNFRSARRIVELGNEIAATLPSYAATVIASLPAYSDEGEVNVSSPLGSEEEEAAWMMRRIDELLKAGESSIMVVFRNDPDAHPVHYMLRGPGVDPKYRVVELLTIHRSKGLQARHVFVGGCTAGRFPLPMGDTLGRSFEERTAADTEPERRRYNDQEINLVYVAATRARWSVTFTIPTFLRTNGAGGEKRDEKTGPSPIFFEVPMLKKICLESGWTEAILAEGVAAHEQKVSTFYQRFNGRIFGLNEEAKRAGLKPGSETPAEATDRSDTAALGVHEILREKGSNRRFAGTPLKPVSSEGRAPREEVLRRCREGFFRNGAPPPLKGDHRDTAFREGWVEQDNGGKLRFTAAFKTLSRPA